MDGVLYFNFRFIYWSKCLFSHYQNGFVALLSIGVRVITSRLDNILGK